MHHNIYCVGPWDYIWFDLESGEIIQTNNNGDFLTPFQEKQMSFQPDFILEYAHYLGDHFSSKMNTEVQVYVDSRVTLNGRKSQEFIYNSIDLYMQNESFKNKKWILPFNDEIAGF